MSALPPLPNPLTPLAWLPEDIGSQLQASAYLFVATLGVRDSITGILPSDRLLYLGMDMGSSYVLQGRVQDLIYS